MYKFFSKLTFCDCENLRLRLGIKGFDRRNVNSSTPEEFKFSLKLDIKQGIK